MKAEWMRQLPIIPAVGRDGGPWARWLAESVRDPISVDKK